MIQAPSLRVLQRHQRRMRRFFLMISTASKDPNMSDLQPSMTFPAYNTARVADLVPYARNARTHSPAQVAQIAASIREFGFTNPILVDGERGVIAGTRPPPGRAPARPDEVPTIELSHLTPTQRRAYVLADNRLALSAGWDDDLLRLELTELRRRGLRSHAHRL
jgi:ParB-like chromosome segregation protein Spo0J